MAGKDGVDEVKFETINLRMVVTVKVDDVVLTKGYRVVGKPDEIEEQWLVTRAEVPFDTDGEPGFCHLYGRKLTKAGKPGAKEEGIGSIWWRVYTVEPGTPGFDIDTHFSFDTSETENLVAACTTVALFAAQAWKVKRP